MRYWTKWFAWYGAVRNRPHPTESGHVQTGQAGEALSLEIFATEAVGAKPTVELLCALVRRPSGVNRGRTLASLPKATR